MCSPMGRYLWVQVPSEARDSYPLDPEYWITDSCALPAVGGGNQIQVFLKQQVLLISRSIYKHF